MWQANAPQNEVGATAEVATLKFFGDGLAGVSPAGQELGREGSEVTECVWYSGSVNFTFKFKNFSTAFVAGTLSLQLQLPQSMADRGGEADRKRETQSEREGRTCVRGTRKFHSFTQCTLGEHSTCGTWGNNFCGIKS